jgi:hypothetical protein
MAKIMLDSGISPALCRLSKTVVIPNPIKPRGAGLAVVSPIVISVLSMADPHCVTARLGLILLCPLSADTIRPTSLASSIVPAHRGWVKATLRFWPIINLVQKLKSYRPLRRQHHQEGATQLHVACDMTAP